MLNHTCTNLTDSAVKITTLRTIPQSAGGIRQFTDCLTRRVVYSAGWISIQNAVLSVDAETLRIETDRVLCVVPNVAVVARKTRISTDLSTIDVLSVISLDSY